MTQIVMKGYTKILKKRTVIDKVDFTFVSGKVYKLRGINGSGKTMLLRALAGLIYPTEGSMYIDEVEINKKNNYPKSLGVMIETPEFWKDYTGIEVLKYLARIRNVIGIDEIKNSMIRVGLNPDDTRTLGKYSLGMKQRLAIAQAVMEHPDIILLDEPLNALDSEGIRKFQEIITEEKERGALIVLAIHNDGEFEFDYDQIIQIEEGKIKEL